jgi:DNA-3-methyladenine glycosylase I
MSGVCAIAVGHPLHRPYPDREYGHAVRDDGVPFERPGLEIDKGGLSWLTVRKKRDAFGRAHDGFDLKWVADCDQPDRVRSLRDTNIIRNRSKVEATIGHARRTLASRPTRWGSFAGRLDARHPRSVEVRRHLFERTLRLTGGEIVPELLVSTGDLPGAHHPECPGFPEVLSWSPVG